MLPESPSSSSYRRLRDSRMARARARLRAGRTHGGSRGRALRRLARFGLPLFVIASVLVPFLGQGSSVEAMEGSSAYRVVAGDTLWSIAASSGLSVSDLAQINNLANPELILAGQVLQLAASATVASRGYLVQPGDTLSG